MTLNEALDSFGTAIGNLKRAFAEEFTVDSNYVAVHVDECDDVTNEVEKLERFKQYETMTDEMAALRDSFVNSGFSKAEAFEMVKMIVRNAVLNQMTSSSKPIYRPYR